MSEFEVATLPEVTHAWGKLNSVTRLTVPRNYKIATDTFTIGRNPDMNDLVINDPRLSGVHTRISVSWTDPVRSEAGLTCTKPMVVTISDLSTNGTYLNKQLIGKGNSKALKNGDEIQLLMADEDQDITIDQEISFIFVQLEDLSLNF